MSKFKSILFIIILFQSISFAQETPQWIAESNKHTQLLLDIMAKFNPESAARYGIDGIDEQIFDVNPGFIERNDAAYAEAKVELVKRLKVAKISEVKMDLQILINAVDEQLENSRLEEKYFLPYFNLSEIMFYSLQSLLDPQIEESRRPAALVRLKKYTGLAEGFTPVTKLVQDYLQSMLKNKELLGPVKKELEKNLENTPRYLAGIKQLFEEFKIGGYEEAYEKISNQLTDFDEFVKSKILPRAREDFRLPEEVYRNNLKSYGVDMPIEELMRRAKAGYKTMQNDMNTLSRIISNQKGWDITDYHQLIPKLKEDQIVGEEILPLYRDRIKSLEELVRKNQIVTLPQREMSIRLASEAESAALPAPHMRPPRLIGNTGEMGEFVLPLKFPGKDVKMDDFTHESLSWTLAVHEGRPGHEMQFTFLVEKGVSMARAIYAMNSVNVEGWALYMEYVMKPYLPTEGQFGTLHSFLMRSARAFLDPGLQLGMISEEEAMRVLREEVILSDGMALQEIQRYTFRAPGQATSYYCGYLRMLELRADVELKLGEQFNQKAFHDFILAQGLIPPTLLRQVVFEKFVPQYTMIKE
jgi:uncharacterized protein DUF885